MQNCGKTAEKLFQPRITVRLKDDPQMILGIFQTQIFQRTGHLLRMMGIIFDQQISFALDMDRHAPLDAFERGRSLLSLLSVTTVNNGRFNGKKGIEGHKSHMSGKLESGRRMGESDDVIQTGKQLFFSVEADDPFRSAGKGAEIFLQGLFSAHAPGVIAVSVGDDPKIRGQQFVGPVGLTCWRWVPST